MRLGRSGGMELRSETSGADAALRFRASAARIGSNNTPPGAITTKIQSTMRQAVAMHSG